jgi:hypothetical protein
VSKSFFLKTHNAPNGAEQLPFPLLAGWHIAIFNAAKDTVEQALSKTSLAELVRGVSYICQQQ